MRQQEIEQAVKVLERNEKTLMELVGKLWHADSGTLYAPDIFATAAIHRAVKLSKAFRTLITEKNFLCAVPIIRLQIDSILRFSAVARVSDKRELLTDVLSGKEIRKIKDREGNLMNDAYLLRRLVEQDSDHHRLREAYRRTSGYIHFSNVHLLITLNEVSDQGGHFKVGHDDEFPDEIEKEFITAFNDITHFLMKFIIDWHNAKEPNQEKWIGTKIDKVHPL